MRINNSQRSASDEVREENSQTHIYCLSASDEVLLEKPALIEEGGTLK